MKVQTLSVVVGNSSCNAKCPFCISRMTGSFSKKVEMDERNLTKACRFARFVGVNTCLITGKGEPTLFPEQVVEVCTAVHEYFPVIELQTNGSSLDEDFCEELYEAGLTTVALSVVHWTDVANNLMFGFKKQLSLISVIRRLHDLKLSVRLCCAMIKDYVDTVDKVKAMIDFCSEHKVEQLTVRPIVKVQNSPFKEVEEWVKTSTVSSDNLINIKEHFALNGTLLMDIPNGGKVYDYNGQNICIGTCLTRNSDPENMRQLIYSSDGHLRYDWEKKGAIIF